MRALLALALLLAGTPAHAQTASDGAFMSSYEANLPQLADYLIGLRRCTIGAMGCPDTGFTNEKVPVYGVLALGIPAGAGQLLGATATAGVATRVSIGTTAGTVAAGDDSRILGALQAAGGDASLAIVNGRTLAARAADTIHAEDFDACTWSAAHDVAACIQAALDLGAALGAGDVIVPTGHFNLGTTLTIGADLVRLVSAGGSDGLSWDDVTHAPTYPTVLTWTGSAGQPMLVVSPPPYSISPVVNPATIGGFESGTAG